MTENNINKKIKKIVFTEQEIKQKIIELANWVNTTYKNTNNLVLVGLLKGSVPFLAELIKHVNVEHELDFVSASSYAGADKSSGQVKIVLDPFGSIENKDVLIVEDIVDSGITLDKIKKMFLKRNPNSVKILALLNKPVTRKVDLDVDKYGFIAPNEFLVGFGLDYQEKLRNLPYIGVFDKKYL
ncbi:hypoxanthine phosphoribosyltransferase [Mycoplasma sp. Mirounga ES2805-ORL]|uniref:hypoxanthine phosphoribosyltransferase n=1 Tax=Mycoplasma sp. Mirounga ES2805-ORL TaxID=754514 RepID=UPI00197CB42A|nr:hypoxanthine phosphoribosyltransferase [Mycoplasma sp. Mirounga ES2805-ORL]QSF13723.1 hypoxanthine phosphoribosyltransferase [Mycoplasma sp. Mirounga ES2805-ORL]